MGLGKTLQAMCVFDHQAAQAHARMRDEVHPDRPPAPTLVVCPTSVLFNWKSELARFRPGLRVAVYHGPGRASTRTPT